MKTLYHGTSSINLSCIEAIGLVPGHAKGGDAYAADHHMQLAKEAKKREPSVFLADDVVNASQFARLAVEEMGGEPIVITVHIPEKVFVTFVVDELYQTDPDAVPHAWRAHSIPAAYVVKVQKVPPVSPEEQFMHVLAHLLAEARS
ncbi:MULTISPECIES: hypothetical protein [unclassified Bradyrhizobium]|uniref:hypothetical protein n=1 Tax=unclassified Bradyrhizobium TaxID=2631580 RepID=UPI0029161DDB|nr:MULTISPECIES: hypothetical protein [unclassified Bradyrhizobium]